MEGQGHLIQSEPICSSYHATSQSQNYWAYFQQWQDGHNWSQIRVRLQVSESEVREDHWAYGVQDQLSRFQGAECRGFMRHESAYSLVRVGEGPKRKGVQGVKGQRGAVWAGNIPGTGVSNKASKPIDGVFDFCVWEDCDYWGQELRADQGVLWESV